MVIVMQSHSLFSRRFWKALVLLLLFFAVGSYLAVKIHPSRTPSTEILIFKSIAIPILLLSPVLIFEILFNYVCRCKINSLFLLSLSESALSSLLFAFASWGLSPKAVLGNISIMLLMFPLFLWVNRGKQST